jgi:hypothetical protein
MLEAVKNMQMRGRDLPAELKNVARTKRTPCSSAAAVRGSGGSGVARRARARIVVGEGGGMFSCLQAFEKAGNADGISIADGPSPSAGAGLRRGTGKLSPRAIDVTGGKRRLTAAAARAQKPRIVAKKAHLTL